MAKKNWLDIATKVAKDTAINALIPGGIIGKAVYTAGKEILNNSSQNEEPSLIERAFECLKKDNYEGALIFFEKAKDDEQIPLFYYYKYCGICHFYLAKNIYNVYWDKANELGLTNESDGDDPRWNRIDPILDECRSEKSLAINSFKESLKYKEERSFVADKEEIGEVFAYLPELTEDSFEKRKFYIAAMASNNDKVESIKQYTIITNRLISIMNESYATIQRMKSGDYSDFQDSESLSEDEKKEYFEFAESELFTGMADYHERQFIYIAKNIDALAGCYDDNVKWIFTIDQLPKELNFPVGHPQPNSLYYAHPAKKGFYLPIESADEELFTDKVRDFRRLVQCLGATEIKFRSVKGHSLSESYSKSLNIEVGGDYKGIGGSVGYGNKRNGSRDESMNGKRELVQQFNPTKKPYIPEDIAWLDVDPEWQSLVKQRLEGNMLHYSMRISSRKTMSVTDSRMDEVKVAFKSFIANANVSFSQQMERSFKREEETEWEISVSFKPLNEFALSTGKNSPTIKLSNKEQEYLDNIREFLEDDAEITPRERKMLDRIRQSLGISEERAKELEASLSQSQLTEDEQEYLEMYQEYAEKGEITEKERRRLDRFASAIGISAERVKELENT